ncbi:MAG: terminase TerL endonuclease subunit, partial [Candidatus Omnitrophota bacterium]
EARGLPSKMATVKRLCFCVWTEAENPAIDREAWSACQDKDYPDEILLGRRCWGGLDLSAVNDLTAFALVFEPSADDQLWRLKVWFWVPGKGLHKKADTDHVPYIAWRDAGYILTSSGEAISKTQVIRFIYEQTEKYDLQGIAYDRNRIKDLLEFAQKEGIDLSVGEWDKENRKWLFQGSGIKMMPFGQEARSMTPAIDKFELYLLERLFRHDGNPCLTWCAANAVIESDGNYRRYSKKKAIGRIDGIQAAAMAFGILEEAQLRSAYESPAAEILTF